MLFHAISAELLKCRRSAVWVAILGLPLLGVFVGCGNYAINASAMHGNPWQDLWTQIGLFYGYFFFPILIAILAAYLWRLEHLHHNWNSLMTAAVPVRVLFWAKLSVLGLLTLFVQCLLMGLYLLAGKLYFHLAGPLLPAMLWWLLGGWTASLSIGALQLYLSMRIRSFAVPVGLCLLLCLMGLGLFVNGFTAFPTALMIQGMGSLRGDTLPIPQLALFLLENLFYIFLFAALSVSRLKRKDVCAA